MISKVSVIIPVYNAEKSLSRAVDSVLKQTFSDFELILIDDGSKDLSASICDKYVQFDKRISCFHLTNGGVSRARNHGLEQAQGEFIVFLDADDWFESDYLERLLELQKKNDADIVAAGCVFKYPDSSSQVSDWYPLERVSYSGGKEIYYLLKKRECIYYCIWDKLYRRALLKKNNIRFEPSLTIGEDSLFAYTAIANAEKVLNE